MVEWSLTVSLQTSTYTMSNKSLQDPNKTFQLPKQRIDMNSPGKPPRLRPRLPPVLLGLWHRRAARPTPTELKAAAPAKPALWEQRMGDARLKEVLRPQPPLSVTVSHCKSLIFEWFVMVCPFNGP